MKIIDSMATTGSSFTNSYHTQLVWHLVKRDFIVQYKRSVLGVLWSLLLPLGQLLVLIFVFNEIIPLKIDSYPLFLFSALLPWSWFSDCISSSGIVFINNRDLVLKPNFDPSILIIVNTLSKFLLFLIPLPLLFILMLYFDKKFTSSLLMLPLLMLIQCILTFGLSFFIATLNSFFRDVQHIVNVGITMLFFLTPIFYDYQIISEKYHFLYSLNPMATLIQSYRLILYYGSSPNILSILYVFIASMVVFAVGYVTYKRNLHSLVDIL